MDDCGESGNKIHKAVAAACEKTSVQAKLVKFVAILLAAGGETLEVENIKSTYLSGKTRFV